MTRTILQGFLFSFLYNFYGFDFLSVFQFLDFQ